MKSKPEIFISYAWDDKNETGESRETIVNELYNSLIKEGYPVIRDKYNVGYKGLFSELTRRIGRAKFIVVAISDKYMKSGNCMGELLEIYRKSNSDFEEMRRKIFPIVLEDANICSPTGRAEYIKSWVTKKEELDETIKKLGLEHAAAIVEDFYIYQEITFNIGILSKLLADMNALSPQTLSANNFAEIKGAIINAAEAIPDVQHAKAEADRQAAYFNMPLRPNYFVGRQRKLEEIHNKLTDQGERSNILLVTGIGGMGKTTLVHEYLHQPNCKGHFQRIIVVSVDKNLRSAFVSSGARAFGLDMKAFPKPEEQLEMVVHALKKSEGNNLFVIDNINEQDKNDLVIMKDIFTTTGWKFLITTRTTPDEFATVDVDELDESEAIRLFKHHYSPNTDDEQNLADLLAHIHRHTLLTESLAKVGKKKGFSAMHLLSLLKEEDFGHPDLQRTISFKQHGETTFRLQQDTIHHYLLSLFDIEYLDVEGKTMIRFFSVLPAEDIPVGDLKILWRVDAKEINSFEDRLDDLQQSGWISSKHKEHEAGVTQNITYKMHPLVQEVAYEKLEPNIQNMKPLVLTITDILSQPLSQPKAFQGYAKSVIDKLNSLHEKA